MKRQYDALVVGAGISGIRTALDLAETGNKVALVDSRPNLGGLLAQLDYQFPSDHCGMCKMLPLTERDSSSQFCMRKGLFHKNIDLMLSTELTALDGEPGHFAALLKTRSTFVDPGKCVGCGLCAQACPVSVPSEFNAGLTRRGAAHLPVPHAIPNHYVIDLDACARCWQCATVCPTGAIDFRLDERKDFHVLVGDENAATAEHFGEWLEDLNFQVTGVASGDEALAALEKDEKIRFLLLDVNMPGMERVAARGLEMQPARQVVLLAEPGDFERAGELRRDLGAAEVLAKPLDKKTAVPWLDKAFMRLVSDQEEEVECGTVVLAAGFQCYNPTMDPQGGADILGYGAHPNVITAMEFERLVSGTGPNRGKLLRPGDGTPPRKIAWLQCVGSRDVRKNADFCSSVCCMFAIKEAVLAKKRAREAGNADMDAAIFYMDMRTFGKNFQSYRDRAEDTHGVRFVRSRIHTILPAIDPETHELTGGLRIMYLDNENKRVEEIFDMVILSTGARPPKNMEALAEAARIERNDWGFARTTPFAPSKTTRHGVMAAGSFGAPRDIAESVITAGAASLEASRLINLYAPIRERQPDPVPEYRDVSRETPRALITLCTSCPMLEKQIDLDPLAAKLETMHSVCKVARIGQACTAEGWADIEELAREYVPNRILVGACMPYAYVPKLRELGRNIGLDPKLMDVVDIYTPMLQALQADERADGAESVTAEECNAEAAANVFAAINMGAVRLMGADPSPLPTPLDVTRTALVVGGGLAGMTAALGVADHGYDVTLVEETEALGGQAMKLHYTLAGEDPRRFMEDIIDQVTRHPHIDVKLDARVSLSTGRAGRYMSLIAGDEGAEPIEHGVTILATGGHEAKVYDYGFRVHKSVLTQRELEEQLATGALDTTALSGAVMIQCWRSDDEDRAYCSRVCCQAAIKNILQLKKRRPELPIYVFYRDMMTYGFSEHYFTQARKAGAVFIRYDTDRKPQVSFEDGKPVIRGYDGALGGEVEIRPDILVLSDGVEPSDVSELCEVFGVSTDENGFFLEAESKWRPVDFVKQGVFMCGMAHSPCTMDEAIASAKAAAQRALRILSEKRLVSSNVVAEVRHSLCSLCGKCVEVCPYGARSRDPERELIVVDELLCQGCGSCATACPNSASVLRGYRDEQVMGVIDAALDDIVNNLEPDIMAMARRSGDDE